jgi:hypothetical protein
MTQQQVLEHEVVARMHPGLDGRDQQPKQFEHAVSIADSRSREVLPPHNTCRRPRASVGRPAASSGPSRVCCNGGRRRCRALGHAGLVGQEGGEGGQRSIIRRNATLLWPAQSRSPSQGARSAARATSAPWPWRRARQQTRVAPRDRWSLFAARTGSSLPEADWSRMGPMAGLAPPPRTYECRTCPHTPP